MTEFERTEYVRLWALVDRAKKMLWMAVPNREMRADPNDPLAVWLADAVEATKKPPLVLMDEKSSDARTVA